MKQYMLLLLVIFFGCVACDDSDNKINIQPEATGSYTDARDGNEYRWVRYAGLDIVWNLADLFMALMTLINLIALIFLGHLALKALKNYNDQKRRGIKSPVFKASDIPEIEDQLSEWK